jgi:cell division protein FtsQ
MRTRLKISLTLSGIILAAIIFMLSPYFYISEVVIKGCETVSQNEVLSRSGIGDNTNLLLLNTKETRNLIMQNHYIDGVTFDKEPPGTLTITVRERRVCGYVEYLQNNYLYIDEYGRVLEVNSFFMENLPVVSGLKFDRFVLGEVLQVEDSTAFKTVVQYAWLFNKHNMAGKVSRIDVSDSSNTKIHIYNIEFNVGDDKSTDEKIRTIMEILAQLPNSETIRGFVDMREINNHYVLKILT